MAKKHCQIYVCMSDHTKDDHNYPSLQCVYNVTNQESSFDFLFIYLFISRAMILFTKKVEKRRELTVARPKKKKYDAFTTAVVGSTPDH